MKRIATLIVGLALLLPSAALANSSTCQAYSQKSCSVSGTSGSRTPPSTGSGSADSASTTAASTLPFTGLDVGLLVGGGVVLLGTGLVVRRLSRASD